MKKVKDPTGSVVRGAYKTDTGSVVFKDPAAQKIYETRKEAATKTQDEIAVLKSQIEYLTSLLLGKQ